MEKVRCQQVNGDGVLGGRRREGRGHTCRAPSGTLDAIATLGRLVAEGHFSAEASSACLTVTVYPGVSGMTGVIRAWDILLHPIVTIRCFGWRIFFKAIFPPWHKRTFVSLLREAHVFEGTSSKIPQLLGRCIGVELQAKKIYAAFARVFAETESASQFFEGLARQEQDHADLLEVCWTVARRGCWKADHSTSWQDLLPRLEKLMQAMESSRNQIDSLDDALLLAIHIESSEVNQVFLGVVGATDSAFVRSLKPFYHAMDKHVAHICRRIPELAPHLTPACRELRAKLPQL